MRLSSLTWALSLVALVSAVPSRQRRSDLVLHEKRAAEPLDWVRSRRLEPTAVLPMRLGLTQNNMDKLEDMLMSVSHPLSPSYGKHFSPQDIVDTFAPSDETVARVTEWLVESGIGKERLRMSASKGWIAFNATVEEVEDLIDAEYHVFTHESGAEQIGGCSELHPTRYRTYAKWTREDATLTPYRSLFARTSTS